jgi:hypothetical protein
MSGLRFSGDLLVPVNGAIARYVLLGKSGSGKTNSDCVLIEEFVRAGVPTIVLDPLGNMYGLRSSADGEGAGLPMAIFGGPHGDVPLPFEKVHYIADLLAEGVSAVLDLSEMELEESVEFAKRLVPRFQQRLQGNAHVVFEEADRFTPNAVGHKNAINTFARTARNGGVGWTFSTQRPQILSRQVIDSASVFIALRMTGSLAQDAIGGEIGSRIGKKLAAAMIADLPKFARGEAWFIPESDFLGDDEPEMEPMRCRFRLRETFDVRPPKVGELRREPKVLAAVDLEHLRAALAIEADEPGDDVDALKARIAELETQVAESGNTITAEPVIVEKPVLAGDDLELVKTLCLTFARISSEIVALGRRIASAIEDSEVFETLNGSAEAVEVRTESALTAPPARGVKPSAPESPGDTSEAASASGQLGGGARKMLEALAGYRDGRASRNQLGALAGYVASGGSFRTYLSALRAAGYIVDDGKTVLLTAAGRAIATTRAASTTAAIVGLWRSKVKGGERKMFDTLVERYPAGVTRAQLAAATGYELSGGSFRTYLSGLRTKLVIEERHGEVFAAREIFPTGAPR